MAVAPSSRVVSADDEDFGLFASTAASPLTQRDKKSPFFVDAMDASCFSFNYPNRLFFKEIFYGLFTL